MKYLRYSDPGVPKHKGIEMLCRLRTLKVGDPITERHIEAVQYFLGGMLDKISEAKALFNVRFHEFHEPHIEPEVIKKAEGDDETNK